MKWKLRNALPSFCVDPFENVILGKISGKAFLAVKLNNRGNWRRGWGTTRGGINRIKYGSVSGKSEKFCTIINLAKRRSLYRYICNWRVDRPLFRRTVFYSRENIGVWGDVSAGIMAKLL